MKSSLSPQSAVDTDSSLFLHLPRSPRRARSTCASWKMLVCYVFVLLSMAPDPERSVPHEPPGDISAAPKRLPAAVWGAFQGKADWDVTRLNVADSFFPPINLNCFFHLDAHAESTQEVSTEACDYDCRQRACVSGIVVSVRSPSLCISIKKEWSSERRQ